MVTITVKKDQACDMVFVTDGLSNISEGNTKDFYSGCKGNDEHLKTFSNVEEYISSVADFHKKNGQSVEVHRGAYTYEY